MINEIQNFIARVVEGSNLTSEEASRAFQIIMNGGATPAEIAAFLIGLRVKKETVEEITGAAITIRAKMETITAPEGAIDVCGTGGDGKGSLNVSTAVALVVAACGVPVVKHGNKSISSKSGSADVLAALGVTTQADRETAERCLQEVGICFLFAPLYHKAMRHVAPIRQELAVRTIFNILGPLINPASPKFQLLGVYDKALLVPIAEVLRALGSEKAWVVHGSDGMDELTLSGVTHVAELKDGAITTFDVSPADAGFVIADEAELKGGNATYNAKELSLMLAGIKSPYRDIVLLNAAAALVVAGKAQSLLQGAEIATAAIDSGKAKETLASLALITSQPV